MIDLISMIDLSDSSVHASTVTDDRAPSLIVVQAIIEERAIIKRSSIEQAIIEQAIIEEPAIIDNRA